MGADRLRYGRGRTARLSAGLVVVFLLLAGCASIPDSGDVEPVKASPHDESQVRVYAVPPPENAGARDIVDGFLEAMTSDDPNFAMARKYLAKGEAKWWRPQKSMTVLSDAPDSTEPTKASAPDQPGLTYHLFGEKIATVGASHVYQPLKPAPYSAQLHLIEEKVGGHKEWRIDALPQGLVLGDSDFQRNYRPIDTYFYAKGESWLVADPVFIRQRIDPVTRMDPVTQAVNMLLAGPTDWLKPVVESSFPPGTRLEGGTRSLEFDDRNALTVPLNDKAGKVPHATCKRMAAQLFFGLRDLTSTRVQQVELRAGGSPLCSLTDDEAQEYAPPNTSGHLEPYYLDASGRLSQVVRVDKENPAHKPVPGVFGDGTVKLDSVAVARDANRAAGVAQEGKELYVASITQKVDPGDPLVTSNGKKTTDRLSAPSWDSRGDLWVADRDPDNPRLLRFENGAPAAEQVTVQGLDGQRIEGIRVSADGVRVALLLTKGSRSSLEIGRVERHGSGKATAVSVVGLEAAAPQMDKVTAVSWAGPSRLVVVGKETGGVQQVRYIQADGSTSDTSVLPGLNQVTAIAAGDQDTQPLVADSVEAGIVRLPSGGNWQAMAKAAGSSPVYPG